MNRHVQMMGTDETVLMEDKQTDADELCSQTANTILWERVCWCTLKECLNCTLGIKNRFILKTITEMIAMMFGSRAYAI